MELCQWSCLAVVDCAMDEWISNVGAMTDLSARSSISLHNHSLAYYLQASFSFISFSKGVVFGRFRDHVDFSQITASLEKACQTYELPEVALIRVRSAHSHMLWESSLRMLASENCHDVGGVLRESPAALKGQRAPSFDSPSAYLKSLNAQDNANKAEVERSNFERGLIEPQLREADGLNESDDILRAAHISQPTTTPTWNLVFTITVMCLATTRTSESDHSWRLYDK
ncbi:hypothetical protein EV702DRAFT_1048971 [Suillus placidus]|uniref:Uncharacterized protein n=1 Tax=Suillus placidus TaxID=48579 RepID=A0A9P6ZLI1_9AGAM|nr:hypothetical protein EV702DRAFT_1048971 [Suillus placidus]